MNDNESRLEELLEDLKEMARRSKAEREACAVLVPHLREVAPELEAAYRLAEATRRPVDTVVEGHSVTVFPVGQMPPL